MMLLTLLAYGYCCGVLSTRAIEDRCRVDATFRVACAGLVPDHSTISRFRQRACGDGGPMEDVFYAVLRVCAEAGLGGLSVLAVDGVKIGANASKKVNRTEAGLRKLAAAIMAGAGGGRGAGCGRDRGGSAGRGGAGPGVGRSAVAAGPGAGVPGGFRRAAGGRRGQAAGRRVRRGWMRRPPASR